MKRTRSFEERIVRRQRAGDGAYLLAHWDSYSRTRFLQLCGIVSALTTASETPASGERRKIRVLDYGCSSGALFRSLEYHLGHLIDFSFVGIDVDRRALGFIRAKLPGVELHEADSIRLPELLDETPIAADIAVVFSCCYELTKEDTGELLKGLSRVAPTVVIVDQIDNYSGAETSVMTLRDHGERLYQASCHPFGRLMAQAGYAQIFVLPTSRPRKGLTGFVVASKNALPPHALLNKHFVEAVEPEFEEAANKRHAKLAATPPAATPPAAAPPAARVNSVSFSIDDALEEIRGRHYRTVSVCGDKPFVDALRAALKKAMAQVDTVWFSGSFADVEQGARVLDSDVLSSECVVLGGPLAHLYHPRLLRIMARGSNVRPVFPVADRWEFCVGQVSFPAEIEYARAYLFNHFQEYFGIRDPILARLEAYDQHAAHERWVLLQPGETVEVELEALLPEHNGPAAISVYTCAPMLTRGRHFRWRFCVDAEWGGSITTLHGVHDIPHATATTEFIQSRASFGNGRIVFTLPNHYGDLTDRGLAVECVDGPRLFTMTRKRTSRIEQVEIPLHNGKEPVFGDYIGCRFGQYTTPYWFSFEEGTGRKHLSANHIQGQSFEYLTKRPPAIPLGDLERALRDHDIVTWPYCVPVLPEESGLEVGLSLDSSWPVLRELVLRFYDHHGRMLLRQPWTKSRPGLVYADELVGTQSGVPASEIGMILVSPDWERMNLDQQKNGISPIVDLALRHRESRDYDITEFQNSWRNLGVVVDQMPHWIHPSNHLLGGTNLYGRAIARDGWRTGALLVNGSGNLHHDVEVEYVVKLFDSVGRLREARGSIKPFTHQLVWLDELFPDFRDHLGDAGYGAMVIRSRDGDLNGQIVTLKDDRSVSLQHMWGY